MGEHKYDPNCKFCMDNVFVKDALKTKEIVEKQELELVLINGRITELGELTSNISDVNLQSSNLSDFKNKYQNTLIKKDKLKSDLTALNSKLQLSENQLKTVESDIEKYHINEKTICNNKKINTDISKLNTAKSKLETEIETLKKSLLKITASVGSLKSSINSIKDKMKEVKDLESKNQLYTLYLESVKRDGIPYELITNALPVIESEINNILGQIVDFHIVMETDGKNINAKIVYENQEWPLEMCSGMEKFISGLAIRVALINICNLPRPNFLVVDEGMGTLDSDNLSSLYMLFTYMKSQFDFILLISHVDSIRDIVDGLIEIKKENGFSKIKY